jgi:hypothetical protein
LKGARDLYYTDHAEVVAATGKELKGTSCATASGGAPSSAATGKELKVMTTSSCDFAAASSAATGKELKADASEVSVALIFGAATGKELKGKCVFPATCTQARAPTPGSNWERIERQSLFYRLHKLPDR